MQLKPAIPIMTALFQNASHTSESLLSDPFRRNAEVKQDDSDADISTVNRTCDAKSARDEDASSILFPTLRRLPIPKPSPEIYTSASRRGKDFEGEPVATRSKPLQAEMPLGKLDEFDAAPETLDRHTLLGSAGIGAVENRTTETRIKEEDRNYLQTASGGDQACERILKLSPSQLVELASTPSSLPRGPPSPTSSPSSGQGLNQAVRNRKSPSRSTSGARRRANAVLEKSGTESSRNGVLMPSRDIYNAEQRSLSSGTKVFDHNLKGGIDTKPAIDESCPSPMPASMPLPPCSLPTYLHLELSSNKPSPLYIHRSKTSEIPYEPSRVKIERLLNFLLLPPQLEQVLLFGTLACLDAFLYSFTILPLRFFKALSILARSLGRNVARESQYVAAFIYSGAGRMWKRKRRDSMNNNNGGSYKNDNLHNPNGDSVPMASPFLSSMEGKTRGTHHPHPEPVPGQGKTSGGARPRFQSMPSTLLPEQKADLLKGFLLILSCIILMYFDASRIYHGIRGQAAIKLYVIYNVLEVGSPA